MSAEQRDYQLLHKISRSIYTLQGISSLLDWDQETYMPEGAAANRAEQRELIAGLTHQKRTSSAFANALARLVNLDTGSLRALGLSEPQNAALKEWRRDYLRERVLPKRFVEKFAKLSSEAIQVWKHAREKNDFKSFVPYLEQIVAYNQKKAELLGYQAHPYDALLDHYEPGITTHEIDKLFSHLREGLTPLLKKIQNSKPANDNFLHGEFPHHKQLEFARLLLKAIPYDTTRGRLDLSAHPFSSASHPTDSRITTRIHESSLMSNIFAVLHEAGHGLYEMGLPVEQFGSPLGEAISLAMHESQSRFWETRIGHSKPFWQYFFPILKEQFPYQLKDVTLNDFYVAINKVEPSYIRIEADEVTYSFHVMLRFELERALIEGSLTAHEIPEAWNARMKTLLGIVPHSDKEGCLQDIHWAGGMFGYFPTYVLGNLYAAHLFQGFSKEHPNWEERVATGELGFIANWLRHSVHQYGKQYRSRELLHKITGVPFSANAYVTYLNEKYHKMTS